MQRIYTKETAIVRGPKTINAMLLGGKYIDSRTFEIIIKSIVSAFLLIGAGIISALLVMM
ncbi:MAG: hypothetical protein IJI01_03885 [Butyrivibrio sp.]|uniref:hypothetical protein n=1 Tax=Butyrivibrio sp. TaxID=28121 RepID=UPI0025B9FD73|nr:hypothetical protein [Butyrivibrio sp.]MBQ6587796.1 hypothetical protein [Butyrivibrio sp.]